MPDDSVCADSSHCQQSRDARTRQLLNAPLFSTLLSLAWPTLLVMLSQTLVGLMEMWFLARLGEDVLAGVSVVFPALALTTALSTGAVGGGILTAVSRALGRGDRDDANLLVWHAVAVSLALGIATTLLALSFGPKLFAAMGARDYAQTVAKQYSTVVFCGATFIWLFNGLLSAVRGTGNVRLPMQVVCGGAIVLIPFSYVLIFGIFGWSGLGVTGGALAMICYYATGCLVFISYLWCGKGILAPSRFPPKLQLARMYEILRVGGISALIAASTNITIAVMTAYVGQHGTLAVAGYGAAARLEFLLVPLSFGIGGPAAILIGTNTGAERHTRADRAAWISAVLGFSLAEVIGLVVAIWPELWLKAFVTDSQSIATGVIYLTHVGPFFGFFGLGFTQYCAAQGTGVMWKPLSGAMVRTLITITGGYLALTLAGLFA